LTAALHFYVYPNILQTNEA